MKTKVPQKKFLCLACKKMKPAKEVYVSSVNSDQLRAYVWWDKKDWGKWKAAPGLCITCNKPTIKLLAKALREDIKKAQLIGSKD